MFGYQIGFASPWYWLWLGLAAVLLAALWTFSFRRLAMLGPVRRVLVIALRSLVVVLVFLALAEAQMVRTSERVTVIYLLDQSLSIPEEQRAAMMRYVAADSRKHRQDRDLAGVIVFGREAAIEIPPFDEEVGLPRIETQTNPEHTNLAGAVRLAQATFPEDAAKRVVVVTDGNENVGSVAEQLQSLGRAGIGVDVVPIRYRGRAEIVVERLAIPADVRRGEPFDLRVVVSNTTEPAEGASGEVRGRLRIKQTADGRDVVLSDEPIVLPPGKRVFAIRQEIDAPSFYAYEAEFLPDRPEDDTMPQNNRATAFTHVRGRGKVLLIENEERDAQGEFAVLVERLRAQGLEIDVRTPGTAFAALPELQQYDTVLLANVPRDQFTDEQISMLALNTQQMGAGLVMLGGPNSFGAGGWNSTEVEEAMPVDFQIKAAKVVPRGALVMIMHACEIPEGNFWQTKIAHEAVKTLGAQDYCGLIQWTGTEAWLWGRNAGGLLDVGPNRNQMMAAIDRMTPGDMPEFDPSMRMAQRGFASRPEAAVRHMIIISDGDPSPPSRGTLNALQALNVTVSTVAVGAHGPAESRLLNNIATALGGTYYEVRNNAALPRIFQREARRVARPLIWDKHPVRPQVKFTHEIVGNLPEPILPVKGFVMTEKKDNPLVETLLVAPEAAGERNSTILAVWTYGLGKTAAFTSDAGARWAGDWTSQADLYDALFGQLVRWSMRPTGELGKFTVATEAEEERVRVVVTALDKDDQFLNFLTMTGTVVGPDLKPLPIRLEQVAPGRYEGVFEGPEAGAYLVNVEARAPGGPRIGPDGARGEDRASIRTGVNVPYSREFRDRASNEAILAQLAATTPRGGRPGEIIVLPEIIVEGRPAELDEADYRRQVAEQLTTDTFRRDLPRATSSQDVWHFVLLALSGVFFFDVFFRRVQVSFAWAPRLAGRARDFVLRRTPEPARAESIERLRSRKAVVSGQLDQARAAARFEAAPDRPVDASALDEASGRGAPSPAKPAGPPTPAEPPKTEEELYTERLLKAKQKVWERKKGDKG